MFHSNIPGEVHLQAWTHPLLLPFPSVPCMYLHPPPYLRELPFSQAFLVPVECYFGAKQDPEGSRKAILALHSLVPMTRYLFHMINLKPHHCLQRQLHQDEMSLARSHLQPLPPFRDSQKQWAELGLLAVFSIYFQHSRKPSRRCSLVLSAGLGLQLKAANSR